MDQQTRRPNGSLLRPSPEAEAFYSEVLRLMAESEIPFLVSGTYALASYTGIDRPTKDIPATSPQSDAFSKDLKARGFSFVGSTIIYAHMQAVGMVNDHLVDCFRYRELLQHR